MPSPMKRNTYFGADPAKVAIAKITPATNNEILYIFDIMLSYYTKTPDKLHITVIENMRYSYQKHFFFQPSFKLLFAQPDDEGVFGPIPSGDTHPVRLSASSRLVIARQSRMGILFGLFRHL